MKILVIGGMHGNEKLGIELANLFKLKLIDNIDSVVANEEAVAVDSRFVKQDLNRSFPGDIYSEDYERRRAAQLLDIAENYDVVFDFHNTGCPNNNCCFIGETANTNLSNIVSFLGLKRLIVADYDCINKYANNCISIEVSINDKLDNLKFWYDRIFELSKLKVCRSNIEIQKYKFVYRITNDDRDRYKLADRKLKAFEPIDAILAKNLGVKSPAYPIFINDKFTPYNYGGLLNKID